LKSVLVVTVAKEEELPGLDELLDTVLELLGLDEEDEPPEEDEPDEPPEEDEPDEDAAFASELLEPRDEEESVPLPSVEEEEFPCSCPEEDTRGLLPPIGGLPPNKSGEEEDKSACPFFSGIDWRELPSSPQAIKKNTKAAAAGRVRLTILFINTSRRGYWLYI